MNTPELQALTTSQRAYFAQGNTLKVDFRIAALKKLKEVLLRHEQEICKALQYDLQKSETETYMCELGLVLSEISYMIRHVRRFAGDARVSTPLAQFAARSFVKSSPRGVCLIMSPWNYPLLLALEPLVDAIAAGNTAIIKPSAYAPATSALLGTMMREAFPPQFVAVVAGGREENQQLLQEKFDYIFFTGSSNVGKEVLKAAAPNLTPVSLELGGKSPCIVDETANIPLAARRIVFGKFLNCGQTCVAPDYVVCHQSVADSLMAAIKMEIGRQYGKEPLKNEDYGKIINKKHFIRLQNLLNSCHVVSGGACDPDSLRMEPALAFPCSWQDPIMGEEIFGPILPVLTYQSLDDLLKIINARPHPLALYFFSENREAQKKVLEVCPFGGGCLNDTIIHLATSRMGFGGVGMSGMGSYHGKAGFEAFSHRKSIVDKKTFLDLPMRYQPYTRLSQKLIRLFLR